MASIVPDYVIHLKDGRGLPEKWYCAACWNYCPGMPNKRRPTITQPEMDEIYKYCGHLSSSKHREQVAKYSHPDKPLTLADLPQLPKSINDRIIYEVPTALTRQPAGRPAIAWPPTATTDAFGYAIGGAISWLEPAPPTMPPPPQERAPPTAARPQLAPRPPPPPEGVPLTARPQPAPRGPNDSAMGPNRENRTTQPWG